MLKWHVETLSTSSPPTTAAHIVATRQTAAGINTVTLYRLLKRHGLQLGRTVRQE